jgi:hypothetical protein
VKLLGQPTNREPPWNGAYRPPDADLDRTSDGLTSWLPPFNCPPLGRTASDQLVVTIRSDGPLVYESQYIHLARIDVTSGQRLVRGQVIGLSGTTGCSTAPHLHFQVRADGSPNAGALVDPYGWEGRGSDPWAHNPSGRASAWLWLPGEAPPRRLQ